MFATCLHCHESLGQNRLIEHFPVGRRLAFDAAKGRLWVVCPDCRRWNLSPIEERWEAIEECERLYSKTRLRASSDNIGIARLAEGLDVVRIGQPKTPEMAAWRYASDFRRRWIRSGIPLAIVSGGAAQGLLHALQNEVSTSQLLIGAGAIVAVSFLAAHGRSVRVALPSGQVVKLGPRVHRHIRLEPTSGGWALRLGELRDSTLITGPQAVPGLRAVMTARNFSGAPKRDVEAAIARLDEAGNADRFIARLARATVRTGIRSYPPDIALALEMALHESSERRAIEGELAFLREEWELAEEIAHIADNMFLPESLLLRLNGLRAESDA